MAIGIIENIPASRFDSGRLFSRSVPIYRYRNGSRLGREVGFGATNRLLLYISTESQFRFSFSAPQPAGTSTNKTIKNTTFKRCSICSDLNAIHKIDTMASHNPRRLSPQTGSSLKSQAQNRGAGPIPLLLPKKSRSRSDQYNHVFPRPIHFIQAFLSLHYSGR